MSDNCNEFSLLPFPFNLACITAGDTYPAMTITGTDTPNGISLNRVKMQIRDSAGVAVLTLDSQGPAGITITNAAQWAFTIEKFTAPSIEGVYSYDMQFTDSNGDIGTILAGTWNIIKQHTI